MREAVLLAEVVRGDLVEARHHGHLVVTDASGSIVMSAGDPAHLTYMRSAAKPLQAVAVVESGAAAWFGLEGRELAVMCASHNGEAAHLDAVRSILRKVGVDEGELRCGAHPPWDEATRNELRRRGAEPQPIHNNCSGKHAGMLALCRFRGWSTDGYNEPGHPVQGEMRAVVAELAGLRVEDLILGVDGCTVPTFGMPLCNMARAFARLAGAREVIASMMAHPHMVAGTGRLCTDLMTVAAGKVAAKSGAEGVFCVAVPASGLGLALKIEDGAGRAVGPAAIRVLEQIGVLTATEMDRLSRHRRPPVVNRRGEPIGEIRPARWTKAAW